MRKEDIKTGPAHRLDPSPCVLCPRGNQRGCMCDEWKAWVKKSWDTVTAREKTHAE